MAGMIYLASFPIWMAALEVSYKMLCQPLKVQQMYFTLRGGYIMLGIMFLMMLASSSAELGYQYQPTGGPVNSYGAAVGDYASQADSHYQDHADFHKHFYAFEAPYDSAEEGDLVETKLADLSQKNLQVVFIKAPENKAVVGALNALAKQSSEDKTAIYVLNKQTDAHDLASQLTALKAQHKHKPQVHFVKYRTEEEAAQAQKHIQAQYGGAGYQPQGGQASSLGYYPEQQPQYEQGYLPELPASVLPGYPSAPQQGYLPPLPSYSSIAQSYNAAASTAGKIDLPPVPEAPSQDLSASYNDANADYRTARSQGIDFRVNERRRTGVRMVFPTDLGTSRAYLPPSASEKRRRLRI